MPSVVRRVGPITAERRVNRMCMPSAISVTTARPTLVGQGSRSSSHMEIYLVLST
jgi:hypothetical protein